MRFQDFIVPGVEQSTPAFAPGVAVRATMEANMRMTKTKFYGFFDLKSPDTHFPWLLGDDAEIARIIGTIQKDAARVIVEKIEENVRTGDVLHFRIESGRLTIQAEILASDEDWFEKDIDLVDLLKPSQNGSSTVWEDDPSVIAACLRNAANEIEEMAKLSPPTTA